MIYVECPNHMTPESFKYPSLFMGGGITGCFNWQQEMKHRLKDEKITLVNPRRKFFDVNDPEMEREQIQWEFDYLSTVNAASFWFTSDTIQPITLFELGTFCPAQIERDMDHMRPIFVGVHPDYTRIKDVKIQLGLRRKDVKIVFDFDELIQQIKEWCRK